MFEFWNQESRLASNTLGRLTQLLAVLYSTGTEKHFLYHSTNLLLELTSRSPDYNRSMFDQPLSECKFEVISMICKANSFTHMHTHTPMLTGVQGYRSILAAEVFSDDSTICTFPC